MQQASISLFANNFLMGCPISTICGVKIDFDNQISDSRYLHSGIAREIEIYK